MTTAVAVSKVLTALSKTGSQVPSLPVQVFAGILMLCTVGQLAVLRHGGGGGDGGGGDGGGEGGEDGGGDGGGDGETPRLSTICHTLLRRLPPHVPSGV